MTSFFFKGIIKVTVFLLFFRRRLKMSNNQYRIDCMIDNAGMSDHVTASFRVTEVVGGGISPSISAMRHNIDVTERHSKTGRTALMNAARAGNEGLVHTLLHKAQFFWEEDRKNYVNMEDNDGNTALLLAASRGQLRVVQKLIREGANINVANKNGYTPLMQAARNGHPQTVRALLEAGADMYATDKYGYSPLMKAAYQGHANVIQVLLEHERQHGVPEGRTPIAKMLSNGGKNAAALALEGRHLDVCSMLEEGAVSLRRAVEMRDVQLVSQILKGMSPDERIAALEAKDEKGNTALALAARNCDEGIVPLLLSAGADVNTTDNLGYTPLMKASYRGAKNVVHILLTHEDSKDEINVNIQTPRGETALSLVRDAVEVRKKVPFDVGYGIAEELKAKGATDTRANSDPRTSLRSNSEQSIEGDAMMASVTINPRNRNV